MNERPPPPPSYDVAMSQSPQNPTQGIFPTQQSGLDQSGERVNPLGFTGAAPNVLPPTGQYGFAQQPPPVITTPPMFSAQTEYNPQATYTVYPPNATVYTNQVILTDAQFGPFPTTVRCPSCHTTQVTRIVYEPDIRTHLIAAMMCFLGFFFCVCLPYCVPACQSSNHYCSNCGAYLGSN